MSEAYHEEDPNFYGNLLSMTNARTNEIHHVRGFTFFHCTRDTTSITTMIRFNSVNNKAIPVRAKDSFFFPKGVRRIFVTNSAEVGLVFDYIASEDALVTSTP